MVSFCDGGKENGTTVEEDEFDEVSVSTGPEVSVVDEVDLSSTVVARVGGEASASTSARAFDRVGTQISLNRENADCRFKHKRQKHQRT